MAALDLTGVTEGYRALREHAAWADLSGRGHLHATGEDRKRLLHAMSTNHVEQLQPGQSCYAFFLSAQGRILADANIICTDDALLVDTEPETRNSLREHLDKYIIADDVTLEDRSDNVAILAIEGPAAPKFTPGRGLVLPLSYTGAPGLRIFATPEERDEIVKSLQLPQATASDLRLVRIETGRPRYGEEITDRFLAQETQLTRALHFQKGCYLGQEIVERVRARAQLHRLLCRFEADGPEVPEKGAKLQHEGANVAEIASAIFSPALNRVVGFAYVRSEFAVTGRELAGLRITGTPV